MQEKPIVLVGFMCSGKTTYGKLLASALNRPFIDTDNYIEEKFGKSVSDIFSEKGESYFRQLEHTSLTELLKNIPCGIIASGGGTPCHNNNMELMNQYAVTVYLQAKATSIFEWLKCSQIQRPLLKGKSNEELIQYIESLLAKRKTFYEQAHITVSSENFNPDELIAQLKLR